jgi:hypothetical protein
MIRMFAWGLLTAILSVVVMLQVAPAETSIDDGWKYTWIALAIGFLAGAGGSWYWRRRKAQ